MTEKHFIALADKIKDTNLCTHEYLWGPDVVQILADFCREQNCRFDRDRWLGYIAGTKQ